MGILQTHNELSLLVGWFDSSVGRVLIAWAQIPFKAEFLAVANGPSNTLGLAEFRSNFVHLAVSSKTNYSPCGSFNSLGLELMLSQIIFPWWLRYRVNKPSCFLGQISL